MNMKYLYVVVGNEPVAFFVHHKHAEDFGNRWLPGVHHIEMKNMEEVAGLMAGLTEVISQ